MNEPTPRRVVFAPALILAALFDARARAQLNEWRDSKVIAVVNRELLLSYMKLLRQVGAEEQQVRQWMLWFTSPEKSVYLADLIANTPDTAEICRVVAEAEGAVVIQPDGPFRDGGFRVVNAA